MDKDILEETLEVSKIRMHQAKRLIAPALRIILWGYLVILFVDYLMHIWSSSLHWGVYIIPLIFSGLIFSQAHTIKTRQQEFIFTKKQLKIKKPLTIRAESIRWDSVKSYTVSTQSEHVGFNLIEFQLSFHRQKDVFFHKSYNLEKVKNLIFKYAQIPPKEQ